MSTASPVSPYMSFGGTPDLVVDAPGSVTPDFGSGTSMSGSGLNRAASVGLSALVLAAGGCWAAAAPNRVDLPRVTSASPHRTVTPPELLGLSPDAPLADSFTRLFNTSNGWAGGEGVAPQLPALAWARDFGKALGHSMAAGVLVAPTLEGGVVLERQIGSSRWSLDIDPDGDPFVVVVGDGPAETSEPATATAAAQSFREFLAKSVLSNA